MSESLNLPEEPASPAGKATWSRAEIDAAIAGLDQATRAFSQRVNAMQQRAAAGITPTPAPGSGESVAASRHRESVEATHRQESLAGSPRPAHPPETANDEPPPVAPAGERDAVLERRMQEAERDARDYLEQAKRRADSLVTSMIGAVERESAEIRREAELGIRDRWRAVEVEASRYLNDAKRVADGMVADRQERIHTLSDGVLERGHALTAGMDDADRIKRQFEGFVRTLSETAARIAAEGPTGAAADITRLGERRSVPREGALAA